MFKKLQNVLLTLTLWLGVSAVAFGQTANGVVVDAQGQPIPGAGVIVKGTTTGTMTAADGTFSIAARSGAVLEISCIGYANQDVNAGTGLRIVLKEDNEFLEESVVTALGIKRERKSLGYAIEDINSQELMRNKSANAINSLSGKIAGVNITQSSGAAGSGAQIILRGGTSGSESRDNQPLFIVDGIIYDNSSTVVGNSGFDGSGNAYTTTSNRVMDINPEDIENMSILKGPAASALYGSRAANGVILITTKKGKEGTVEVTLSSKYTASMVKDLPAVQNTFKRGSMQDTYDTAGNYLGRNEFRESTSYNSWGAAYDGPWYNNLRDFFRTGNILDNTISVAGGTKTGNFYLSASAYNQDGVVPTTGYDKYAFRFNGEQKWKIFTITANAAYSQAHTDKTLTSGGLWGSSGTGSLAAAYLWSPSDDMTTYLNADGTRLRMFGTQLDPWDERDNPYWIINKDKLYDQTNRFTGGITVKADITPWWWIQARLGLDTYTQTAGNTIAAGSAIKQIWEKGMMSENTLNYDYISTNILTNFNKSFGDFNFNLMLGTSTDSFHTVRRYMMAYGFEVPEFYSFLNTASENRSMSHSNIRRRLVSAFGEFRADWKNTLFFTVTGRRDWTSTLPIENRSYFYPSVSGAFVFSQLLQDLNVMDDNIFSFGKIRASWARVGKDTGAYETATALWPVGTMPSGAVGVGNSWSRGNPYIKPEMTESTELGIELSFLKNRLHIDYAFYTNNSYNQILSPRGPQSTGYIFCSINAGNVLNKGMELTISGTPVETRNFSWNVGVNMAGNRGRLEGLPTGQNVMYVTDVQYAGAQAASFNNGNFMAIAGTKWNRDDQGRVILDDNYMPTYNTALVEVGNREATLSGGINNTLTWKNLTFNMLWEFRLGGDVINGTRYAMDAAGVSQFSADFRQKDLTINGVMQKKDGSNKPLYYQPDGTEGTAAKDAAGHDLKPVYEEKSKTYSPGESYDFSGQKHSGEYIIENYYGSYYPKETANYITKVNALRLRSISLTYDLPKSLLKKTQVIQRASITAAATNLLLFTNYQGDPEAAASGAGVGGSSSVGFDYLGVPATRGFSIGLNITF